MRAPKIYWNWLLMSLCACIYVLPASAQEIIFVAKSSSNIVGLQSRFQVSYTIHNAAQITRLQLPSFAEFMVVGGPLQSSSFSTINGSSSSSTTYTYFLQPKKLGNFTIASASVQVEGHTLRSNPIEIKVVKGNSSNAPSTDPLNDPIFGKPPPPATAKAAPHQYSQKDIQDKVFARVDVDKTKATVGEQVTASYNIYSQLPLSAGFKKLVSPDGFWMQDYSNINPQNCERVVENGKEYRKYTLRKTALYPTREGVLTIPSVEIEGNVDIGESAPRSEGGLLGGIMQEIFGNENVSIPVLLVTKPIAITAAPLPVHSGNAVSLAGLFAIEGNLDKQEMTTDEVAKLVITVKGNGNIKMIPTPQFAISGDWESSEPIVHDTITNMGEPMSGYKTFTYTLVPRNAGELHIDAATLLYYNLATKKYDSLFTPCYIVKVKNGNKKLSTKQHTLPRDIHDIVVDNNFDPPPPPSMPYQPWYWALYLLPLGALAATKLYAVGKKNKKQKVEENGDYVAQQRLQIAKEMLAAKNATGFYNETAKAMWLYVSDRCSMPLSKLNKASVQEVLAQKNISPELSEAYQRITQQCEEALYASEEQGSMQEVYNGSLKVIAQLENQLKA